MSVKSWKNMGMVDRIVRITIALGIGALYLANVISGTLAIILGAFAVIFVLTSLVGSCPLYLPFGLSTIRKKLAK